MYIKLAEESFGLFNNDIHVQHILFGLCLDEKKERKKKKGDQQCQIFIFGFLHLVKV